MMDGDRLVSLINMRADDVPVRKFLMELREEPVVRPDLLMGKVRYLYMNSGVVLVQTMTTRAVVGIYLHGPGSTTGAGYAGELPQGLKFFLKRAEVRERIQGHVYSGLMGQIPFDAWEIGRAMLRVAYNAQETIAFVALLPWHGAVERERRPPGGASGRTEAEEPVSTPGPGRDEPGKDASASIHGRDNRPQARGAARRGAGSAPSSRRAHADRSRPRSSGWTHCEIRQPSATAGPRARRAASFSSRISPSTLATTSASGCSRNAS
jgi:hypothetical protein